jgi:hypothetical protein
MRLLRKLSFAYTVQYLPALDTAKNPSPQLLASEHLHAAVAKGSMSMAQQK